MNSMLEILKERLPEGLEIINVKDKASSSQIEIHFSYQGMTNKSWLYKTCAPGCANKMCDQTICCTMMGFALKLRDLEMADHWKEKMLNG